MSTEVYSWRVSSELKSDLEREARLRKTSLSAVLTMAVRDWLRQSATNVEGDEEQRQLHEAASQCLGAFADGNPRRAENARQAIRERLRRQNAR
jgi:hypothetical protein